MNTLFRSALLAALFVLPAAAFAQPVAPASETQVEMIAYEAVGSDSAPAQAHTNPVAGHDGTHVGTVSDTQFNPAYDVGLKSIYLRH